MANCIKCGEEMGGKLGVSICQECVSLLLKDKTSDGMWALAKIGLDALVDEATGFQKMRAKDDLAKRLKQYQKEMEVRDV